MKIKMLKSTLGADDDKNGVNMGAQLYRAGQSYDVGANLAKNFKAMGVCENEGQTEKAPAAEPAPAPKPKRTKKNLGAAPENKAAK